MEIPFSEWVCDVTQVKNRWECSIGEIYYILGEISLLHNTVAGSLFQTGIVPEKKLFLKQSVAVEYCWYLCKWDFLVLELVGVN